MAKSKNSVENVSTDLQIDEQIDMQENGWIFQAIGLVFIFIFIGAAAMGVFGNGFVSKKKQNNNSIEVEHERYYRFEAQMPLKITAQTVDGNLIVSVPNSYLENFEIESILPEPTANRFDGEKVFYEFEGSGGMKVTFYLIARKVGSIQSNIIINESEFHITHFIYP
jgi:hypothetical protein